MSLSQTVSSVLLLIYVLCRLPACLIHRHDGTRGLHSPRERRAEVYCVFQGSCNDLNAAYIVLVNLIFRLQLVLVTLGNCLLVWAAVSATSKMCAYRHLLPMSDFTFRVQYSIPR